MVSPTVVPQAPDPKTEGLYESEIFSKHATKDSCTIHTHSQTPHLDKELRKPPTAEALHNIIESLTKVASETHCTECAIREGIEAMAGYSRQLKLAKRDGQWTKAERKALKRESKMVLKGAKQEVKASWR